MAQFDVYANSNPKTKGSVPYLLDAQSDLLNSLATRVVIPLVVATNVRQPITRLNPTFEIKGTEVLMSTPELAGVPTSTLGPFVESLKEHRADIINALDVLFTGV